MLPFSTQDVEVIVDFAAKFLRTYTVYKKLCLEEHYENLDRVQRGQVGRQLRETDKGGAERMRVRQRLYVRDKKLFSCSESDRNR